MVAELPANTATLDGSDLPWAVPFARRQNFGRSTDVQKYPATAQPGQSRLFGSPGGGLFVGLARRSPGRYDQTGLGRCERGKWLQGALRHDQQQLQRHRFSLKRGRQHDRVGHHS